MKRLILVPIALLSACTVIPPGNAPVAEPQAPIPVAGEELPLQTLEGTRWTIMSIAGRDALADRPADLLFDGGRVSGASGCNRFSGSYDVNTTALTIGALAATKMACPGTAMEQERRLFEILKGTLGMRLKGDTLTLTDGGGRAVIVQRAS